MLWGKKKNFFHQKIYFFQHLFVKLHTHDYRVSQVVKETSMLPSEIDQMHHSRQYILFLPRDTA